MSAADNSKKNPEDQPEETADAPVTETLNSDEIRDAVVLEEPSADDEKPTPSEDSHADAVSEDTPGREAESATKTETDTPTDEAADHRVSDAEGDTLADSDLLVGAGDVDETIATGNDTLTGSDGEADVASSLGVDRESVAAAPSPQKVIERETVVRKGGFVPMVLGGAVAAVLGFLAAPALQDSLPFLTPPPDPFEGETRAALADQGDSLADLGGRLDEVSASVSAIDLTGVEGAVGDLSARVDTLEGAIADLSDQVAGYESRLTELEKEPLTAAVSPEAIAAYERELQELQAAVEAQRAEIQTMAADAVAAEQNASVQAEQAQARAALAQLTAQLQNGAPFAEQLATLNQSGVSVPEALSTVDDDGVATLTALAADYPDLARAALAAAREGGGAGDGEGIGSFLQRQLGARSVTPRDGDDPDAILSRAEAAVNAGDLGMAVTELSALPDAAQSVMSEWMARAEARQAALGAAARLATELNQE